MSKISVDREIRRAKASERAGAIGEARAIYEAILQRFPSNMRARQALAALAATARAPHAATPEKRRVAEVLELLNREQFALAAEKAEEFASRYPESFEAWYILGLTHERLGKLERAEAAFRKSAEVKPQQLHGFDALARVLRSQGRLAEALEASAQALCHNPENASALNNFAALLSEKGELRAAAELFGKAVRLKPDYAQAHYGLGAALQKQDKYPEAIACFERALRLKPDFDLALAEKLTSQAYICDWSGREEFAKVANRLGIEGEAVHPFVMLAFEDHPERHAKRSRLFGRQTFGRNVDPPPARPRQRPGRLRIGYFSADFQDHPMLYLSAGLFREHDKSRYEIFIYSYGVERASALRERVSQEVEHFIDVAGWSDRKIIDLAHGHDLDIAVDLMGYTKNTRSNLFGHALAPVQVNFLGYPHTMSVDCVNYIVADPVLIPESERAAYSEEIIYLPHCYMPTDNRCAIASTRTTRADFGLPEDGLVLCCFNQSYKQGPREFDIWMRLLAKIEGSVLWLRPSNERAGENLRREARTRGIDPERLVFASPLPHAEHLARHKHADLFVDNFNYNAHTTACDALWTGLPVVTMAGRQFSARVGASLLSAIDLPELITHSEEEYEALILELAADRDKLAALREKLARNRLTTPLFDTAVYTRAFEHALETVHASRCTEAAGDPAGR